MVIRALGVVTPKLEDWLQHIPGTKSKVSVDNSQIPKPLVEDPSSWRCLTHLTHKMEDMQISLGYLYFIF